MFKNLFIIAFLMANTAIAQQPKGKIIGKIVDATNNQQATMSRRDVRFINLRYNCHLVNPMLISAKKNEN